MKDKKNNQNMNIIIAIIPCHTCSALFFALLFFILVQAWWIDELMNS